MFRENQVLLWTVGQVCEWAENENLSECVVNCLEQEEIDGCTLLHLTENDIRDLRFKFNYAFKFSDIKKLSLATKKLANTISAASSAANNPNNVCPCHHYYMQSCAGSCSHPGELMMHLMNDDNRSSPPLSINGRATSVPPELFKTAVSIGYSFVVTWITSFVMVIVHERVPDMKRYPPLPDIFLDNVPTIPWAFHMCEITGTLLFSIWTVVCIFHKYRTVLLRRFFGIAGTVFLLRCVTMLITSLSVPGTHLTCNQNDFKVDDSNITLFEAVELRISRAYTIWSGLGMSIQGVRTCGDYMFSGHTVALTLLNFFITEYTPRNLYFLHTMTWLLNMFGIFFILAAHEHYSIDVFVAFYITSRLFLYYHTLANNQALMSHDSTRTRIWFPMFSYLESSVDGIIPNEFDTASSMLSGLFSCILTVKDMIMLTTRRFWITPPTATAKTSTTALNNNSKQYLEQSSGSQFSGSGFSNSKDFQDISKKDI